MRLGGHDYLLPPRLPLALGQYLVEGRSVDAITLLFGAAAAPAVLALLTDDDLSAIAEDLYGINVGESAAASRPSASNGGPSKPTSPATTAPS